MNTDVNPAPKRELRVVTVNIWQPEGDEYTFNYWPQRLTQMLRELKENGFDNNPDSDVVIGLQEVLLYKNTNPAYEIGKQLGFREDQVHFFPTRKNGKMGVALITNLPVTKSVNKCVDRSVYKDPNPLSKVSRRNVGILEVTRNDKPLVLAVTHLTYITKDHQQVNEAKVCLSEMYQFAKTAVEKQGIRIQESIPPQLGDLAEHIGIIICGDYNADQMTDAYKAFNNAGLEEWTAPLRATHPTSWPVNNSWLTEMIQKKDPEGTLLNYNELARWMDYIHGKVPDLTPQRTLMLGEKSFEATQNGKHLATLHISDHKIPALVLG